MAGIRLNNLIRHHEQVEFSGTGNHPIPALLNDRQFAAAISAKQICGSPCSGTNLLSAQESDTQENRPQKRKRNNQNNQLRKPECRN